MRLRLPRLSIRQSLVLQAFLIVLASLAIFAFSAYRFIISPAIQDIAHAQMEQAAGQMQARMQRVGGELQVQSAPGATVLTVHLMPAQASESQPEPLL